MRYPWVSLAIVGIWLGTAITVWGRADILPERVILIAMITTIIVALLGFKTPRGSLPG